eukprot:TRINITY_DN15127_c0_g1_i1.p1 TRINITY_DN15127_c0_g1~~TRINITY_DN15127_c0_g1_i1.p1  ORF type:complete len:248 (-),score=16.76 TRINITY_DN15127_c0_g1_i1:188-931(-)
MQRTFLLALRVESHPRKHKQCSTVQPWRCFSLSSPVQKKVFTILERSPEEAVLTFDDAKRWWSGPGLSSTPKTRLSASEAVDINIDAQEAFVRGPSYEKHVLALLKRLRFSVVGTGRAGDGGIDFQGWWLLPDQEVRIFGQCKNETKPIQPKHIRDFVGSLETRKERTDHMGLFVSRSEFSAAALSTAQSSSEPLLLLVYTGNTLSHVILNRAARARVPALGVSRKHSDPRQPMTIELTYFYEDSTP